MRRCTGVHRAGGVGWAITGETMETLERDYLLKVIRDLRQLRKRGGLDETECFDQKNGKWRNILGYTVLASCVKHHCQVVRLEALALISESKKSTQNFSTPELNLIINFLEYNLGEKLEFVPYIKKVLRRVNDSLNVLQRQLSYEEKSSELYCSSHKLCNGSLSLVNERICKLRIFIKSYHCFLSSLKDICLNNLHPGAVHCRKRSALLILHLMQEFSKKEITDILWNQSRLERLIQCFFNDTYETNKEVSFQIIKRIEINVLNLNNEVACELIDTALELANSMRPIDTITASYMLKMVTLSPIISNVLCKYIDLAKKHNCVTETTMLEIILMLVNRLKKPLKLAKRNIISACKKYSLYGYLFCIQSLLKMIDLRKLQGEESWRKLIAKIISICFELNNIASKIVNNSSPEGHFPKDLVMTSSNAAENSEEQLVTPQMVLLCSWRIIKESSLLFGYLTLKSPITTVKCGSGLISEEQIRKIGYHFVTLLCETKHRGAFEQAYVGFELLCNRLWSLKEENLQQLPLMWLHFLFLDISGLKRGHFKLCTTRRSAGVPFMVQAIVCSEPHDRKSPGDLVLYSVMKVLLGLAQLKHSENITASIKILIHESTIFSQFEEVCDIPSRGCKIMLKNKKDDVAEKSDVNITEIKTHALNILRALFKHSKLEASVQDYIADGFKVAIRSYDGKSWAERNAATLLIGTLITRTFGVLRTKDHINLTIHNKMSGKIFFGKYIDLLPFMLKTFQNFLTKDIELIDSYIQPILLMSARLLPDGCLKKSHSAWKIDKFIDMVSQCGTNRVYKTRELAARALASLIPPESIDTILILLMEKIINSLLNPNALHGYILQLHGILHLHFDGVVRSETNFSKFLLNTGYDILQGLENTNVRPACFPAATSLLDTVSNLLERISFRCLCDEELSSRILSKIYIHLKNSSILKRRPGKDVYETAALNLMIEYIINPLCTGSLKDEIETTNFWQSVLTHVNINVQIVAWRNVFTIIKMTKSRTLLDQAIFIAVNTRYEVIEDREVQDALYDFLHACLLFVLEKEPDNDTFTINSHMNQTESKIINQFCRFIAEVLYDHMQHKYFYKRASFIKIVSKTSAYLQYTHKEEFSIVPCKDVHKLILANPGMGCTDLDCKMGIVENLRELYIESSNSDGSCLTLDWWTTLMNLLLDDNMEIRKKASLVICGIEPRSNLECHYGVIQMFFQKFFDNIVNENPTVALTALIFWCISSIEKTELKIGIFNKCSNYDCFEPLWVSKKCSEIAQIISKQYFIDQIVPVAARYYLTKRLHLQSSEMNTFPELIANYRKYIPHLEGKLCDILDPAHNSKLIQSIAYKNLENKISGRR